MAATIFQLQKLSSTPYIKKVCDLVTKEPGRRWNSKYFLTSPIFYVNAEPHIGHLYTAVIGDAAKRFQMLKSSNLEAKYMVGTDEHGLKVAQAADENKMDVQEFCNEISKKYKHLFRLFNIEYDDFVRTTETRHVNVVETFWNKIYSKNLIYSDNYSGWYSIADEMFVPEQYLDPKPGNRGERYTLEGRKQVLYLEETNYKFKLKSFQKDLLNWVKGDKVVKPEPFHELLVKWIEDESFLSDISVSRPVERVPWGIPVPGDPSQTIYVWLDALCSYLCTNGYPSSDFKWPPDVQIVGKDILKFHGIIWPALLMAADLEPPRCIFCHSHWLRDGEKMSKSKGNVVDPLESMKSFTSDGLRYFLLRGGVPHSDGNFSTSKIIAYLNAELADVLGNLLLRCTGQKVNPAQEFPPLITKTEVHDSSSRALMKALQELPGKVTDHFEEFKFYKGIEEILSVLHTTNQFWQRRAPWKYEAFDEELLVTLNLTLESLRVCGLLLQPIVPQISNTLLDKLSVDRKKRQLADIQPFSWQPQKVPPPGRKLLKNNAVLFSKIQPVVPSKTRSQKVH